MLVLDHACLPACLPVMPTTYHVQMTGLARGAAASGVEPSEVAQVVLTALTAPQPKARYLVVTSSAWAVTARRLLPDWLWDKLVLPAINASGSQRS